MSRALLVDIACEQREQLRALAAFHAWKELLVPRRLREQEERLRRENHSLVILTTLEQQRQRLLRSLHEAHLENRWHRQYLGSTLRHKMLLLLWCGRTLRRCWLAWGAHMVRVRIEREVRDELRQLTYALRVATLSRHAAIVRVVAATDNGGGGGGGGGGSTPIRGARGAMRGEILRRRRPPPRTHCGRGGAAASEGFPSRNAMATIATATAREACGRRRATRSTRTRSAARGSAGSFSSRAAASTWNIPSSRET